MAKPIKFNLVLFGIGLSVIDEVPEELIYLSLNQLSFSYGMNSSETSLEVKIGRLQIDNQIFCTPYPIVLYPTLTPLEDGKGFEPFLHFCAVKSNLKVWEFFFVLFFCIFAFLICFFHFLYWHCFF